MSLNMDLTKTPDLQDFLKMEADMATLKRESSPVNVGIPHSTNPQIMNTPAKQEVLGETRFKDTDSDGNATDTTMSVADISINSGPEDALDGLKSPSPATAEAMDTLLADEDLISDSIPISMDLPKITAKMTSTSAVIKPEPTLSKPSPTPTSTVGKMIAVNTGSKQKPIQIIKKTGGGGPIVTKYILKPAIHTSSGAASKTGQKVMVATTNKLGLLKSPIKNHQSNIILSPIKGGFKIPISPMKSPIKVSVLGQSGTNKVGSATAKIQNILNTIPSISEATQQYKVNSKGSISVQMPTSASPASNNGIASKSFTVQQPVFVQQKVGSNPTTILQTKPNQIQTNAVFQHVNVIPSAPGIRVDTAGMKYQFVQIVNPASSQANVKQQAQHVSINHTSANNSNITINNPLTVIQQPNGGFQRLSQNILKTGSQAQTLTVSVATPSAANQKQQRLIMPATSNPQQIRQNISALSSNAIIPGTSNIQSYVVPAKYLKQLDSSQHFNQEKSSIPPQHPPTIINQQKPASNNKRKPCNCTKSQCLKLYCECFANGHFCDGCNCNHCFNNLDHEAERSKAIKLCLERNPSAFRPKIGRGKDEHRTHQKGCNCKRSGCLKNYCECYEARIPCTSKCKCIGCKNYEETGGRRSLMSLADAAEVREKQQMAAKNKLSSQIGDLRTLSKPMASTGERLPYTFFTQEVIEATCTCLLAQAEEAEKTNRSLSVAETMILEEFGRCLMQIIQSAGKAKVSHLT